MEAGDHEIIMLTGCVSYGQELVCSQAHLRHERAHAHLAVLYVPPMVPCESVEPVPGTTQAQWVWARTTCFSWNLPMQTWLNFRAG